MKTTHEVLSCHWLIWVRPILVSHPIYCFIKTTNKRKQSTTSLLSVSRMYARTENQGITDNKFLMDEYFLMQYYLSWVEICDVSGCISPTSWSRRDRAIISYEVIRSSVYRCSGKPQTSQMFGKTWVFQEALGAVHLNDVRKISRILDENLRCEFSSF